MRSEISLARTRMARSSIAARIAAPEPLRGQLLRRHWLGASANLPHRLSPEILVSLERADDAGAPGLKSGGGGSGASVMDDGRNPWK